MRTQTIVIIGAVILALYLVFRRSSPSGITTQLNLGSPYGTPAGASQAGILAASFGSLGASIARALGGGSALPSGTPVPAPLVGGQVGQFRDTNDFYAQQITAESGSLDEPTFANNSNSFTIVGTGPAPIAAPNVTPSNAPSTGVLSFLNPNGNIPPPTLADAGTGNYSTGSSAISPVATNYGATGVSLDGAPYVPVGVGGPIVNTLAPEDLFS